MMAMPIHKFTYKESVPEGGLFRDIAQVRQKTLFPSNVLLFFFGVGRNKGNGVEILEELR